MNLRKIIPQIIPALLLTACAGPVIKERGERFNVLVVVPCVDGERPATITALRDVYPLPVWQTKTVQQKAALVGAQALKRQSYGDGVAAATAGCP